MPYQDRCLICRPLPPQTIMRDAGPADSCCGRCGARVRLLYVAGAREPEPAGPALSPAEYRRLSAWALSHPDELEARSFAETERRRLGFVRWLRQTGRVAREEGETCS